MCIRDRNEPVLPMGVLLSRGTLGVDCAKRYCAILKRKRVVNNFVIKGKFYPQRYNVMKRVYYR